MPITPTDLLLACAVSLVLGSAATLVALWKLDVTDYDRS